MNPDEIIGNYENWLHKTANEMLDPSDLNHDDLVQEGRIAMWHALETFSRESGALPAWLTMKAKYRMTEVSGRRRPWTGEPKRHDGWNAEDAAAVLSLDLPRGEGVTLTDLLSADKQVGNMDLAYHEKEIHAAVANLTLAQRQYVVNRFWHGLTNRPGGIWYGHGGAKKKGGARKKLAAELAHLEDMAV